ncbi:AH receptor-interacting protein [Bicyclus anynana]|uniref:AH receptor-interacting protein n=1 Tax=Bicyclus anynana TaxID=110368 RepID=A0A6J1N8K1_BICAN|nr:AH receptor-interacting protein [Bicyclus anynana]XP_052741413.1 AH receptor-interacting protein [Bicyclus anynana]
MNNTTPIIKNTICAGRKYVPIVDGCRVHFNFQTWKLQGNQRILLDDNRKMGKKTPMILVLGHKFMLRVWEDIVKMMSVGEIAGFKVTQELVFNYPFVSKKLRDNGNDVKDRHSCTMKLHTEGLGYHDLDEYMSNPCDLEFIIEMLKVEQPHEFEKEMWQYPTEELLDLVPRLKEKGNKLYAQKLYDKAEKAYYEAISICEKLQNSERKCDPEWISLNQIKLPILLNYVQCQLIKGEYYSVIVHCNTILEHDKDNEKALYRRGKAHIGAWNPSAAEEDFQRLKAINPSLSAVADKELENLKLLVKQKEEQERNALRKLFDNSKTS